VDNKPDCSALFLHLAQDANFGLRIFIWVWTTSLMVLQYFFIWLRQNKGYIMEVQFNGGSIADKVDFARNHFESCLCNGFKGRLYYKIKREILM